MLELPLYKRAEKGLLVKKWTAIVRLSKQVQDLEKKLEAAEATAARTSAIELFRAKLGATLTQ